MAKTRKFSDVFAKYKTYDTSEGFGSADEWARGFDQTMGHEEATSRVKGKDPLSIMGFTKLPTFDELKRAYRKLVMSKQHCLHLDASQAEQDEIKEIIAAYTVLEKRLKGK